MSYRCYCSCDIYYSNNKAFLSIGPSRDHGKSEPPVKPLSAPSQGTPYY